MISNDTQIHIKEKPLNTALTLAQRLPIATMIISLMVILGWIFNEPFLTRIHDLLPAVQPNTALGLLIGSCGVFLVTRPLESSLKKLLLVMSVSFVLFLGFFTLYQYLSDVNLGIDQFLFARPASDLQPYPGRPSPQTSFNFVLLSLATGCLVLKNKFISISQILAFIIGINAIIATTGYIFSTQQFYGFPLFLPAIGMAIYTSVCFIMLSIAILCASPKTEIMRTITSSTRSGYLLRRSVLTSLLAPPVIGTLTRIGVELNFYDLNIHFGLFTLGFIIILVGVIWITAKNAYEEELQSKESRRLLALSEIKFRSLLESAQDGILSIGPNGAINFVNHQISNWFGYDEVELIGKQIEILIPERFKKSHVKQRDKYLTAPTPRPMGIGLKLFGRRKNGSEFPVDIALSPAETSEGKIVMAIIRDVTAQKKKEEQLSFLSDASHLLSESMDFSTSLVKLADFLTPELADGVIFHLYFEKELRVVANSHIDSKRKDELLELGYSLIINEEGHEFRKVLNAIHPVLISEPEKENNFRNPSGNILKKMINRNVNSYLILPLEIHGIVLGSMTLIMDHSKRTFKIEDMGFYLNLSRRIAVAVENSQLFLTTQKAISIREDILANVYDLKNPLSSVLLNAQMMQDRSAMIPEGEFVKKIAVGIQSLSKQMLQVISNLWDATAIETGKLLLNLRNTEIEGIILKVNEDLEWKLSEKKVSMKFVKPETPMVLHCDEEKIHQAIYTLLLQAITDTLPNEELKILLAREDSTALFIISNTGPSLSVQEISNFFERSWGSKEKNMSDSYLRLYIAKGIIEAHGGEIRVENSVGHGVQIVFRLPLHSEIRSAPRPDNFHIQDL